MLTTLFQIVSAQLRFHRLTCCLGFSLMQLMILLFKCYKHFNIRQPGQSYRATVICFQSQHRLFLDTVTDNVNYFIRLATVTTAEEGKLQTTCRSFLLRKILCFVWLCLIAWGLRCSLEKGPDQICLKDPIGIDWSRTCSCCQQQMIVLVRPISPSDLISSPFISFCYHRFFLLLCSGVWMSWKPELPLDMTCQLIRTRGQLQTKLTASNNAELRS